MSIQYMVLGFEPTIFGTRVSSHPITTRPGLPPLWLIFLILQICSRLSFVFDHFYRLLIFEQKLGQKVVKKKTTEIGFLFHFLLSLVKRNAEVRSENYANCCFIDAVV